MAAFDEEVEEVDHPNVVDDDLIDDADEYISEDSIDDDVDVNDPFINMYYEQILIQMLSWMKKKMNDI